MKAVSILLLVWGMLLSIAVAAPVHGQRAEDLVPRISFEAVAADPAVRLGGEIARFPDHSFRRDQAPPPLPVFTRLSDSASTARRSATGFTIGGAVAGALIGSTLLFAPANCRTAESMCGLGLPVYAGGGAIIGGLIGYRIGTLE